MMLFLIVIIMVLLLGLQGHGRNSRRIASRGVASFRSSIYIHAVKRLARVILLLVLLVASET